MSESSIPDLEFHPVTPDCWPDMEKLFSPRGAIGGCWCMWWRIKRVEFERKKGEGNHQAMQDIIDSGKVPGILAYAGGEPIAWCSVAPREDFPVLDRSPNLKRVDDQPTWSIVCFFIAKPFRHQGFSAMLIEAALEYARSNGARIVEGYPIAPRRDRAQDIYAFTGMVSTFQKAGFVEAIHRSETRPIMRYYFED